jgi:uncharacterized cupredoxin-like copper-binding protein
MRALNLCRLAPIAVVTGAFLAYAAADTYAGAGKPGHGHGAQGHHDGGHHKATVFGQPGKASDVKRTITVTMFDNYYEPEEISVTAGETVHFKIVNKGEFLHEFGLGTAAMHAAHQKEMAVMMEHGMIEAHRINHERMKMDHGPDQKHMGHKHGAESGSVLVEPGKSAEIIWKFAKPTELEFACNIPGHYESGMMGPIHFH